ncbi:MAG: response regulator, partial [Magnetococcus sp. YQC-5]
MVTNKIILIVDDQHLNIKILANTLPDYKKEFATSGAMALTLAQSDPPPDLILLDIIMPDMDGYEVCQKLKANPKTADIPIIFVTGQTNADDETKGLQLGAVDYLIKPINPAVVRARVQTHLA